MFELISASMAIGIALFTALLLHLQSAPYARTPIFSLLLILAAIATGPLLMAGEFDYQRLYISLLPSLFFVLLPSMWLYHDSLVCPHAWRWRPAFWLHIVPVIIGVTLSVLLWTLPNSEFEQMFFGAKPVTSSYTQFVARFFFIAMCFWCLMSLAYVGAIILKTVTYRRALKHAFAEDDGKTLAWVNFVAGAFVVLWLYALLVLLFEERFIHVGLSPAGLMALYLAVTITVGIFGLRQQPGFVEMFEADKDESDLQPTAKETYSRSALNDEDIKRIANKLNTAIEIDRVHLVAGLHLAQLAKHIDVPSQYISQTLSQHLHTTFFDLINEARINDAKQQLLTSNKSVLDIALAVGFNARSSFYKAFKSCTGLTPTEYRKSGIDTRH
ncbi:helix-turn-helix transcriptional regulator [Alteromonas sp. ASW11-36]|uniref:Helix-turn-helix transcriptional regulator n=1 Tax=Alteromonas arenosi TaxID=3055817 RepID=A0ABT7SYU4_9ALTE|nr:helix-turn-helix transcriptional regulator [Alteromonas sp. ASW11-36]MDM7860717.1 helix-turn-helix transcriptional regulator [Alteromonas sp. ASW11-36]